jgi:uncharacterized membrane protein YeaQ/YmgE (transglycosylase-associated protein family)
MVTYEAQKGGTVSTKANRGRLLKTAIVGLVGAVVAIAVLTPKPGQGAYRAK